MDSSGSHKVVQIPEDTFRKMRDKLKKQDERIKSLEDQLISMELDKDGSGADEASEEKIGELGERIHELEDLIETQKGQLEQQKVKIEQYKTAVEQGAAEGGESEDSLLAATRSELEEKEELLKYLMEREKQLLAALEGGQQKQGGNTGGSDSAYIEKGASLLVRLEKEMAKREDLVNGLISKVFEAKDLMEQLKQRLLSLPTHEDIDNTVKQALQAESSTQESPGTPVSYEGLLERIRAQLDKAQLLKDKLKQEQESLDLYKAGLTKRFDYLSDSLDSISKIISDRGERMRSAKSFIEEKYREWKTQDEERAKQMSSLWGMIETQ